MEADKTVLVFQYGANCLLTAPFLRRAAGGQCQTDPQP